MSSMKKVDNVKFVKVIMDYAAILFTQASSWNCTMQHMSDVLSILREFKKPLKNAYKYVNSRMSTDVELHDLLQRLLTVLQELDGSIFQKLKWRNSLDLLSLDTDLIPFVNKLEHEVNNLTFFLKRIGIYDSVTHKKVSHTSGHSSAWAIKMPTNENPSTGALWPLLFLPERNLYYYAREELLSKTLSLIQPVKKPTHLCVVNHGGYGGMGRSQLVLEAAYASVEKGTFGVVFWLSCVSESSLTSSFYAISRKISSIDPNFLKKLDSHQEELVFRNCVDEMIASKTSLHFSEETCNQRHFVISAVIDWLNCVPLPYLMIFDKADNPSFFNSDMFPLVGRGSIVFVTGFSHISQWTKLIQTRPKAIEVTNLSFNEGIQQSEACLDMPLYEQSDKEAMIEIIKFFNNSPTEYSNAILTINCLRNCSFREVGPIDYIKSIKSNTNGPAGLVNSSAQNYQCSKYDSLRRVDASYRSVLMRLYTANEFENVSKNTQRRVIDLFAFISPHHISSELIYLWLSPELKYSPMKISIQLNRPAGLGQVPQDKSKENFSTELCVIIQSCYPRMLRKSGDFFHEWKTLRSVSDLISFLEMVQPHCSSRFPKRMLVDVIPKANFSLEKAVTNFNSAFFELCEDPLWPSICKEEFVMEFLNIHVDDCCHISKTSKVARIMDPLTAVGLIFIEKRTSVVVNSETDDNFDPEATDHQGQGEIMFGINSGIQDTFVYMFEQEMRSKDVSAEVLEFLYDAFRKAPRQCNQFNVSEPNQGPSAFKNGLKVSFNIPHESLLPHVCKCIAVQHSNIQLCLELCRISFLYSKSEELYYSAEYIARRYLHFLKGMNGSPKSIFVQLSDNDVVKQRRFEHEAEAEWQYNVGFCLKKQQRYAESVLHYSEALKARQAVSLFPDSDEFIALVEKELGDNYTRLHSDELVLDHYEAALKIYRKLLQSQENPSLELHNHVVTIYEHVAQLFCFEKKFKLALQYNDKAMQAVNHVPNDIQRRNESDLKERSLRILHRKARILAIAHDFENAYKVYEDTLQACDVVYSKPIFDDGSLNKSYRYTFSQLKSRVSLLCNMSRCCKDLARYDEAKKLLSDAELLFEEFAKCSSTNSNGKESSDSQKNEKAMLKLRNCLYEQLIDFFVELCEVDAAVPYAERARVGCIEIYGVNHHETSLIICKTGNLLKALGWFNEASKLFKNVLSITDQSIRLDGAVAALNSLADMATIQADYDSAENLLQDALKILQHMFKDKRGNDPSVADQYILLAELKKEQQQFEIAKDCFESALNIQKECYGCVHLSVAHTLDHLSDLFSELGELKGAQLYREQSSKVYDQLRMQNCESDSSNNSEHALHSFGSSSEQDLQIKAHQQTSSNQMSASALHNIASLLSAATGDVLTSDAGRSSEPLHARALRILSSQYGKHHPRVAFSLNNLAKVLSRKGEKVEAQAMLESALGILRRVHGENHPHVATALHNLGIMMGESGAHDKAILNVANALKIRRLVAGGNCLHISESLSALGFLYYQVDDMTMSKQSLSECLTLQRDMFDGVENKIAIAVTLNNLGLVMKRLLCHSQSEKYMRESLMIRQTIYGDAAVDMEDTVMIEKNYHPVIACAWFSLGNLLIAMARYREARTYLEHCLAARKLLDGNIHAGVANSLHSLADLCICERRFGEASTLLREVIDIRAALYGDQSPFVLASMQKLWLLDSQSLSGVVNESIPSTHEGKILFGSAQETEVFERVKMKFLRAHMIPSKTASTVTEHDETFLNDDEESSGHEDISVLDKLMNAFEDSKGRNAAAQYLKYEAARRARTEHSNLTKSRKSNKYSNVEGGDGWPERLIQKMMFERSDLITELRGHEVDVIEKRSVYGQHESTVLQMRRELSNIQETAKELEMKYRSDKRVKYELDECKNDEKEKLSTLKGLESNQEMANLLLEIKGIDDTIALRENQLLELNNEISHIENVNKYYLECKAALGNIDGKIDGIRKRIETTRAKLVHMPGIDSESHSGESMGSSSDIPNGSAHVIVMNDATENNLKAEITDLVREKMEYDISRELEEVTFQRIFNKLESLRMKFNVSAHNQNEVAKAISVQNSNSSGQINSTVNGSFVSDSDDGEDDSENDSNSDSDNEDGKSKTKKLKKKVRKQKMLIDLLKNQIINLGHKPIEEIVTFQRAEKNLQNALARIMDGDESASDDFDKWDEFVRNHPEYKARQERIRDRFKKDNFLVNKAALRRLRSLIPAGIVSHCTLSTLEESLPKSIAKRIWLTKALWLTRLTTDRIARLHVADLQSKYSPQGLDELELRAVYAALPEKFDNDAKGEKAAWCEAILQSIQSKCRSLPWTSADIDNEEYVEPAADDVDSYIEGITRHVAYRNFLGAGPYDPDEKLEVISEEFSAKDEVSSQEEMRRIMGSLEGDFSGDSTSVSGFFSGVEGENKPLSTTNSIRRRASMFGATNLKSKGSSKSLTNAKKEEERDVPKASFLGELKLKARQVEST